LTEYRGPTKRLTTAMKTLLVTLSLALAGAGSVQAQTFRPETTAGAILGAITGAIVGGHNHDRWGEGAAIGGVAGALLGTAVAPQQPVYQQPVYQTGVPVYSQPVTVVQPTQAPVVYQNAQGQLVQPAPQQPQQVYQTAPQVVYVQQQPQVVYVDSPYYYNPAPVVSFGFNYGWGPRYFGGHPGYYGRGGFVGRGGFYGGGHHR
jgi:hypothetical protein